MASEDGKMIFLAVDGKHVLQPQSETARSGQNIFFDIFESLQEAFVEEYSSLSADEKVRRANDLSSLFVNVLMNGDQASFKMLVGTGKGLMNKEELSNVKRDLTIAKKKKMLGEYRMFFLLDVLPHSNRRADAIIINNDYDIELHDFSEGVVVRKIHTHKDNIAELTESERSQLKRKERQRERIESFQGKVSMDSELLENVIIDSESVDVRYYCAEPKLFDFNGAYRQFLDGKKERVYIPSSLCFLTKKEEGKSSDLVALPLKTYIDAPHFTTEGRFINSAFIDDIYEHDTRIVVSHIFLHYFFSRYTSFDVVFRKRMSLHNQNNQVTVIQDGKKRGVWLRDSRTNKYLPFVWQLLYKHVFMNMSLSFWCEYLSAMCNDCFDDRAFNQESFYVELIKKDAFFFDA